MKLFTKDIDKKLFAQFPKGGELANQKVIAKIFNPYGRGVWYIINSDPNDPDYLWAIVNLFEVEVGSVSRKELESLRIKPFMLPLERDLSFSERNALEVYKGVQGGERYEHGGELQMGIKKEMKEHGMSHEEARKTASDHLKENPHYYSISKEVGLADGGEMENRRTLKLSDAVLYRGETFYLIKRNNEVGLVSYAEGAWGVNGRFLPLGKMYRSDLEENLTDMYGNKVNIPSYDELMEQPYGFMEEGGKIGDSNYLCQMAEEYAEKEFEKPVKKGQCVAKGTKNGDLFKYTEVTVYFKDGTNHLFKEEDFEEFFDVDKYAKGGKTKLPLNYVSPKDISILKITTDDGIYHLIKGESIISGEYKLAKGGKLSDNYVYIPKRNIDKVILKNGETTDDKFNGFYVKKEALNGVENKRKEDDEAVSKMKETIDKVKSIKTLKPKEIAGSLQLASTFSFQDAVEKSIKENKKSEAIDVYAEGVFILTKSNKNTISENLAEFGNPNAINLFPSKYVDVPSLKLKSIPKKSNIENDENWLKQIDKFTSDDSLRPSLTSIKFDDNSVVATDANILIHIYNETKVESKQICVSNTCKKLKGDDISYPDWRSIVANYFSTLKSCEIDLDDTLKLSEFINNQYSSNDGVTQIGFKTKERNIFFNTELTNKSLIVCKLLGMKKVKMFYSEYGKNRAVYFTHVDASDNVLKNDFILIMPMLGYNNKTFGIDTTNGDYVIMEDTYKKGGVTFDDKVKAVENNLFGKEVPKKYRNLYGKTYDKTEAHESAQKIIGAQVKKYKK